MPEDNPINRVRAARQKIDEILTTLIPTLDELDARDGTALISISRELDGIALGAAQLRLRVDQKQGDRSRVTVHERVRRALGYNRAR